MSRLSGLERRGKIFDIMKSETSIAILSFLVVLAATGAERKTLVDLPVSSVGNAAYLTSASDRPWWNDAWTRRAPLLVSSAANVPRPGQVVDVIVDFGEAVNPDEVRVVTPWETEVACCASEVPGAWCLVSGEPTTNNQQPTTKLRLLFKADFRIEENKPFLVYWGNPNAKPAKVTPMMPTVEDEDELTFNNGILEVCFDKHVGAGGFLKRLRIPGSGVENELLQRATGPAFFGFKLDLSGKPTWSAPKVTADNAFVKEVTFEGDVADVTFALYAEQPRLDWRYRLKTGNGRVGVQNSFGIGGAASNDTIYYPGATGKVLAVPASLDQATDCIPWPAHGDFHKSFGEGWYAVRDRVKGDVVGFVFDRPAVSWMNHGGHFETGVRMSMSFQHEAKAVKDGTAAASGAYVAMRGGWQDVREQYRRLQAPLLVRTGRPEARRAIEVKVPRLDRDWCADFNVGAAPTMGHPLDTRDWPERICDRVRSYGANVIKTGAIYAWELPLTPELYNTMTNIVPPMKHRPYPSWEEVQKAGTKLKEETAVAHRRGIAMSNWPDFMGGFWWVNKQDRICRPECRQFDRDIESLFADCGIDSVHNWQFGGEGLPYAKGVRARLGNYFWKWPVEEKHWHFDALAEQHEWSRVFYADSKRRHPDLPVFVYTSEDGELLRDFLTSELAGNFDTLYVEMLPQTPSQVKHTAKRMRSLFDNEPGRTVHHHFYFYDLTEAQRVKQIERPFICGVNGFSVESLLYELADKEYSEIVAGFYRFAEYTKLGEKVAKMAPAKDVAVFRDDRVFREDILRNRVGTIPAYGSMGQNEARIRSFGEIPNFTFDIVISKFFTRDSLKRYNAVYVPENDVLSAACVEELLAYVKAGGGAVIEGCTVEKLKVEELKSLKDGVVTEIGKGKVVWVKEPLTDRLAKRDVRAMTQVRKILADVGAKPPYTLSNSGLDGNLQIGPDGAFLGVVNNGNGVERGVVKLDYALRRGGAPATECFVLDVKSGVRTAITNGTFAVSAPSGNTGYYLIGDETFTSVPETAAGASLAPQIASVAPKGVMPTVAVDTNFVRVSAIEFVPERKGKPVSIRRSREAAFDVLPVTEATYDPATVNKFLKKASYVHFVMTGKTLDRVFADCKEGLKAMLARGGAILVDRSAVGPEGHRFLDEVGVFDVTEKMLSGVGDTYACWNEEVPTNVAFRTSCHTSVGNRNSWQYSQVFATWDKAKQVAPFVASLDKSKAMLVWQENVCGKGKVIFSGNVLTFSDWYENTKYGDNMLSWIVGRSVKEHAKKVEAQNGGLGEVVE